MSRLSGFRGPLVSSALIVTVLVGLTACAPQAGTGPAPAPTEQSVSGDIPDNQVFITVSGESGAFAVNVPEGWASSSAGGVTTYTDKLNSVSFGQSAVDAAPSVDTLSSQLDHFTSGTGNPTGAEVTAVTTAVGDAFHIAYEADSAAGSVTGKVHRDAVEVYVFWRVGQQVELTLKGPVTADNVDPWKIVSDSFHWTA